MTKLDDAYDRIIESQWEPSDGSAQQNFNEGRHYERKWVFQAIGRAGESGEFAGSETARAVLDRLVMEIVSDGGIGGDRPRGLPR